MGEFFSWRNVFSGSTKKMPDKFKGNAKVETGCWMLDAGCWMLDAGCWMLDAGYWILDTGCWMLDAGYWILVPEIDHLLEKAFLTSSI